MRLATRKVHLAGITTNPDSLWMNQVAKNLTDCEDGFLNGATHLLLDRDTKFTAQFQATLQVIGVEPKLPPPRSPNLNAHRERFMRSIKIRRGATTSRGFGECFGRSLVALRSSIHNRRMSTAAPQRIDPRRRRRWWQFSLGTALALVAFGAIGFGLLTTDLRPSWHEIRLKAAIEKRGGHVSTGTHGPDWAQRFLPKEQLQRIEDVSFVGQAFTDADLELVAGLENLRMVSLDDTSITLAAVDRLVERRPELRITTAYADELYEHALYAGRHNHVSVAVTVAEFQQALAWKLAIAPSKQGTSAELMAYEQLHDKLQRLTAIKNVPGTAKSEVMLVDCALARAKMAWNRCQADRDAELIAGEHVLATAEKLPAKTWGDCQAGNLANDYAPLAIGLAVRISGDVRRRVAELRGNQEDELTTHRDAINFYHELLRQVFKLHQRGQRGGEGETLGAIATLLSAEQAHLAIKQASHSPDVWKTALRRAAIWNSEPLRAGPSGSIGHVTAMGYPADVWFELRRLDAQARSDEKGLTIIQQDCEYFARQQARKTHAFYSVGAKNGEPDAWYYDACRMLTSRLDRVGQSLYTSTQRDADTLLLDPTQDLPLPKSLVPAGVLNWASELAEDLKEASP